MVFEELFTILFLTVWGLVFLIARHRWYFTSPISFIVSAWMATLVLGFKWLGLLLVFVLCIFIEIIKKNIHKLILPIIILISILAFVTYQFEKKESMAKETTNEANQNIEQAIGSLFENYVKSLSAAINAHDFSLVAPYIDPDSKLYQMQIDLVDDLHNRNITETFYQAKVNSIKEIASNQYEITTFEEIGITKNGQEKVKQFHYTYTVIKKENKLYISRLHE